MHNESIRTYINLRGGMEVLEEGEKQALATLTESGGMSPRKRRHVSKKATACLQESDGGSYQRRTFEGTSGEYSGRPPDRHEDISQKAKPVRIGVRRGDVFPRLFARRQFNGHMRLWMSTIHAYRSGSSLSKSRSSGIPISVRMASRTAPRDGFACRTSRACVVPRP